MSLAITKDNFEQEVLQSEIPVLVDFWAAWCTPCRMVGPVVDELAEELSGKVKVCKLNVDELPDLAMKYGAMSIPMFAVFKDGEVSAKAVGAMPKDALRQQLKLG